MAKPRTRKLTAAAAPSGGRDALAPAASGGERGITGTTNFSGQLRVDENTKLDHAKAFGISGALAWGEWERLGKTDPHIAMALDAVCDPIRDARWTITPAAGVPESKKHAEFLTWNLSEYIEPGFNELKNQAARGALRSGFSLFEKVIDVAPSKLLPGGEGFVLRKLAQRLPSSVKSNGWIEGESLDLEAVKQLGPRNDGKASWSEVELKANELLLLSWQREGNNYQGVSAFRSVYYYAKIREMLAKLIGISMQRESAGVPVAVAADRTTVLPPEDRSKLEKFLANLVMHEQASAVMPSGFDLKWVYSPGANKGHVVDTWNALGLVILQVLGAQQMMLGTNGTGSRSVGEVHAKASVVYIKKVCAFLEEAFNGVGRRAYTGPLRQLIDLNFGPQSAYPKLCIEPEQPQLEPTVVASAVKTFVEARIITPTPDDENVARKVVGFPPKEESPSAAEKPGDKADVEAPGAAPAGGAEKVQDTALNGAQVTAAQAIVESVVAGRVPRDSAKAMLISFFNLTDAQAEAILGSIGKGFEATPEPKPVPFGAPAPEADPEGDDEDAVPARPKPLKAAAKRGPWVATRPLRASEQHLEPEKIAAFLDGAREAFERAARPVIVEMLVRAQPAITAAMADGDPSEVATLALDTKRLDAVVGEFLAMSRTEGQRQVRSELARARAAGKLVAGDDRDTGPASTPPPPGPSRTDKVFDAQRKSLVRRMESRLRTDIESAAIDVVRTGGDAADVTGEVVAKQLDSGAFRQDAGAVVTKAWNLGRDEALQELDAAEVEYSAILDDGTCASCAELDGRRLLVDSDEYYDSMPPNRECAGRDNCRCLYTVVAGSAAKQREENDDG